MLCDMLDEFQRDPRFHLLMGAKASAYPETAEHVRKAARYNLDREAVWMVSNLSEVRAKNILEALPVCRLPHPLMWVEFAYKDRDDWFRSDPERLKDIVKDGNATNPSRLGMLLSNGDSPGQIVVQVMWTHAAPLVEICGRALCIETAPDHEPSWQHAMEVRSRNRDDQRGPYRIRNEEDRLAANQLDFRITAPILTTMGPYWRSLRGVDLEQANANAEFDLRFEWRFAISLLIILNSRNLVSYGEEPDFSKLNRIRSKRGKPTLLGYRDIHLNLSKVQRNRGTHLGGSRTGSDAHLVAGHWKIRKTGVFWWGPHNRGGEARPPRYQVTA